MDKLRVYFTIDTETSMGGAWSNPAFSPLPSALPIFGQLGSKEYGITLIMDILEEHGFLGTFFTEVFWAYTCGFEEAVNVFRRILNRGHDAQLHLHPVFRFYRDYLAGSPRREQDLLYLLPETEQDTLIGEGVDLFHQLSGRLPRAFRAGCYGASETTLRALNRRGIHIDSSYNLCYLDGMCGFRTRPLNTPICLEGVWEFPITNFRFGQARSFKPLEISSVSVPEIMGTLRRMRDSGCRDAVLVFHSFSFLKCTGVRFEKCRPDRIVIARFRHLCAMLKRFSDEFEVSVMGQIDLSQLQKPQPQEVPSVGWIQPVVRKAIQGINRIPWV